MKLTIVLAVITFISVVEVSGQTSTFTYQGKLTDGTTAANGAYQMQFSLFDALSAGNQVGTTIIVDPVNVTNGIFTVNLSFAAANSFDGSPRWIEIAVKKPADSSYTVLGPRQGVTSSPYAIKSLSAETAINSAQLGGIAASQYVVTTDSRMTDARSPTPGSSDYIQNRTTMQELANFNVNGTGRAVIFDAATQFNIGGNRIVGNPGSLNIFAGLNAGSSNTNGAGNAFVGDAAGRLNVNGNGNSYFGRAAGESSTGSGNSFIGATTGQFATGANNVFFGAGSGRGTSTAIPNTASENAFFGYQSGMVNTTGNLNAFFGAGSGRANTTGLFNAFFGGTSGLSNEQGIANAFFGMDSGRVNVNGGANSFFGRASGFANTNGNFNVFLGYFAGQSNTTGSYNTVLGTAGDVASGELLYATAIGGRSSVGNSDTIVLGKIAGTYDGTPRPADTVQIPGSLNVAGFITGNFSGSVATANNALNLGGIGANQYVQMSDPRLTDARQPLAGSTSYIQNQNGGPQASGNFNIGGNGTIGTDLSVAGNTTVGNSLTVATNLQVGNALTANTISASGNLTAGNTTIANLSAVGVTATGNISVAGNGFVNGNLGVGTNSPSAKLQVVGSGVFNSDVTVGSNATVGGSLSVAAGGTFGSTLSANSLSVTSTLSAGNTTLASLNASSVTTTGNMSAAGNGLVSGDLRVGGASAGYRLSVLNTATNGLRVQTNTAGGTVASFGGNGRFQIDSPGVAGGRFDIFEGGGVLIGAGLPDPVSEKLYVYGTMGVLGKIYLDQLGPGGSIPLCYGPSPHYISNCSSSLRYKKNVDTFRVGLDLINRLRPVSFKWKADDKDDLGLVAEEVAAIEPLLATYNEKGEVEGVKYDRIGVVLINVVKAQQTQIEEQQKQIDALKRLMCKTNPTEEICRNLPREKDLLN